ncbi:MAG TPA: hypothetical protein VMH78_04475 [Thermoplasmata archaeon]|nr:hypothetical protein [Thermoplasmata archaeon]
MVADSIIGIAVVVVVVAVLIYLWPKIFTKAPDAARAIGRARSYYELGQLEGQRDIQKLRQELNASANDSKPKAKSTE